MLREEDDELELCECPHNTPANVRFSVPWVLRRDIYIDLDCEVAS